MLFFLIFLTNKLKINPRPPESLFIGRSGFSHALKKSSPTFKNNSRYLIHSNLFSSAKLQMKNILLFLLLKFFLSYLYEFVKAITFLNEFRKIFFFCVHYSYYAFNYILTRAKENIIIYLYKNI